MDLSLVFEGCFKLTVEKAEKLAFESAHKTQAEASLLRESAEGELETSGGAALDAPTKEAVLDLISSAALSSGLLNRIISDNSANKASQTAQHEMVDVWAEIKSAESLITKLGKGIAQKSSKTLISQQIEASARCIQRGLELLCQAISRHNLGDAWLESAIGIGRFLRSRSGIQAFRGAISKAVKEYAES